MRQPYSGSFIPTNNDRRFAVDVVFTERNWMFADRSIALILGIGRRLYWEEDEIEMRRAQRTPIKRTTRTEKRTTSADNVGGEFSFEKSKAIYFLIMHCDIQISIVPAPSLGRHVTEPKPLFESTRINALFECKSRQVRFFHFPVREKNIGHISGVRPPLK